MVRSSSSKRHRKPRNLRLHARHSVIESTQIVVITSNQTKQTANDQQKKISNQNRLVVKTIVWCKRIRDSKNMQQ